MKVGRLRAVVVLGSAVLLMLGGSGVARAASPSQSPQGNWVGTYGASGYDLAAWSGGTSDLTSMPGVSVSLSQGYRFLWQAGTSSVAALESPDGSSRTAATWYDPSEIKVTLTFQNAFSGNMELYAVDWQGSGARGETITVGGDSAQVNNFSQGAWVTFPITAGAGQSVTILVDRKSSVNAVLSGIFLDATGSTPGAAPPATPSSAASSSSAASVGADATSQAPQGNWVGTYGASGYDLAAWNGGTGDLTSMPAGVSVSLDRGSRFLWQAGTSSVAALESPDGSSRTAATWYDGSEIKVTLTFQNAFSGNMELYAVDWQGSGARGETITVGGQSAQLSNFSQGAWVTFPITASAGQSVTILVDRTASVNAVLSGIFLDATGSTPGPAPTPTPTPTPSSSGSAGAASTSQSPQGNWVGTYGASGYDLAAWNGGTGDLTSMPGVSVSLDRGSRFLWQAGTGAVAALESASGSSRTAATWYDGTEIKVTLTFQNAFSGNMELYAVDWQGNNARAETITVGGQSAQLSNFSQGAWVTFPITASAGQSVTILVDRTASVNAVLSGIFLDATGSTPGPAPTPTPTPTPTTVPQSFFSVANYSANQLVFAGDLGRFNTKWWSGGFQLSDFLDQTPLLAAGYHFLPTFDTGYFLRLAGLTDIPASTSLAQDPTDCITTSCTIDNNALWTEVGGVESALGGKGNYYSIGNEPDDAFSDNVEPDVYAVQFADWMQAIKAGDGAAKIVAPNMSSFSCCATSSTQPFGTAGAWFAKFVAAYEAQNGGTKPPIDVLGMHLYNFDPTTGDPSQTQADNYLSEVESFRAEADSLGYAGVPIWITELGFYNYSIPLTQAESSQITQVLTQLAANASTLNLQRVFLYTNNDPAALADGLDPLYDPSASSSPTGAMPLTDYGTLVANLATNPLQSSIRRAPTSSGASRSVKVRQVHRRQHAKHSKKKRPAVHRARRR